MLTALSRLFLLSTGTFLLAASGLAQDVPLTPLPITAAGLPEEVTAMRTDQADLQRVGYSLTDGGGNSKIGEGRDRSYTFDGLSGSTAVLIDREFPAYALGRRKLVFDVTFSIKEGRSAMDIARGAADRGDRLRQPVPPASGSHS